MSLVFLYVVCNKHFYKPAKNQTVSGKFPEIMAKKRSRGHPKCSPDMVLRNLHDSIIKYIFNDCFSVLSHVLS